jgi:hypothetical protein
MLSAYMPVSCGAAGSLIASRNLHHLSGGSIIPVAYHQPERRCGHGRCVHAAMPVPREVGVSPHELLLYPVHMVGLPVSADGRIGLPS